MKFGFLTSRVEPAKPENYRVAVVSEADLPLHCPKSAKNLWALHPRVYLPIDQAESGEVHCPYCGTLYKLDLNK